MKNTFKIIIIFVFTFTSCKNDSKKTQQENKNVNQEELAQENKNNQLIKKDQVGIFKIGDAIPKKLENYAIKEEKQTISEEGVTYEEIMYTITKDETEILKIYRAYDYVSDGYNQNIGQIMVNSNQFKTEKNIGVGTTLENLKKAYPNLKIWYTYVSDMYVAETDDLPKIQFLLDPNDFIGELEVKSDIITLKETDFKENAKILQIRVF